MSVKSLVQSSLTNSHSVNSMLGRYESNYFHHLETVRLSSSASSITFSNLERYADFQHLQIRGVSRSTGAVNEDTQVIRFNGDSGTNYASHYLYGVSGTPSAGVYGTSVTYAQSTLIPGANIATGIFAPILMDIVDPFSSNKYKTLKTLSGYTGSAIFIKTGLWMSLSPITSIQLFSPSGYSLSAGSRLSLYGFKASA